MYDYLLPIGTVVQLKGAEKYLMIFGVLQKQVTPEKEIRYVDYIAVPFPVGYINNTINIGFNHDQIEKIVFRGFEDGDDWTHFKQALESAERINKTRDEIIK